MPGSFLAQLNWRLREAVQHFHYRVLRQQITQHEEDVQAAKQISSSVSSPAPAIFSGSVLPVPSSVTQRTRQRRKHLSATIHTPDQPNSYNNFLQQIIDLDVDQLTATTPINRHSNIEVQTHDEESSTEKRSQPARSDCSSDSEAEFCPETYQPRVARMREITTPANLSEESLLSDYREQDFESYLESSSVNDSHQNSDHSSASDSGFESESYSISLPKFDSDSDSTSSSRRRETQRTKIQSILAHRPSAHSAPLLKLLTKSNRSEIAQKLFEKFNSTVFKYQLPKDLALIWSNKLSTTAGRCWCKINNLTGVSSASLELSCKVLTDYARLESTLAHELCHAAAWLIDGISKPPHGAVFQKWSRKVTTVFPQLNITTCHNYEIQYKFRYQCCNEQCQVIIGRHSKSININRHRCGRCNSALVELGRFKADGTPLRQKTRSVNQFASYVQSNYSACKATHRGAHKEIMKILARDYTISKTNKGGEHNHQRSARQLETHLELSAMEDEMSRLTINS